MACVTLETALVEGVDYDLDLVAGLVRFKSTGQLGPDLATFLAGGGCGAIVSYCGDTLTPTLNIPCPVVLNECLPCDDDPVLNISAEDADSDRFVFNFDVIRRPPLGVSFTALGCKRWCYSEESLFDAQLCAVEQAVECVNDTWREPTAGTSVTLASNQFQQCSVTCADGSTFGAAILAGRVFAPNLIEANRIAFSLACQRARALRICILTTSPLPDGTGGEAYTQTFQARGGTPFVVTWMSSPFLPAGCNASLGDRFPYTWSVVSGDLPGGLTLAPCTGILSGTPTEGGTFNFTIRATDSIGSFQQKPFVMEVDNVFPVPLAYYKLEAWDGVQAIDSVAGKNLNANIVNAPTVVAGKLGNAFSMEFFRVDRTGDPDFNFSGRDFTIRFWYKPTIAMNESNAPLDWTGNAGEGLWFMSQLNSGGQRLTFELWKDSFAQSAIVQSPVMSLGTWHHVVFWHENGVAIGCKVDNGEAVISFYAGGLDPNLSNFFRLEAFNFAGANAPVYDEISIWNNIVLTAAQITTDFNSGNGQTYPFA